MGVVPAMLNYFVTRRRQVQRESKDAFAKGNDALGKILDLLQLALKILANATYGFTGVGKTKGPMLGL
jgi:DNA polymerase elongation subunit (family B)